MRYGWCDFCQLMRDNIEDCCECMASLCTNDFCQSEHDSFCATAEDEE